MQMEEVKRTNQELIDQLRSKQRAAIPEIEYGRSIVPSRNSVITLNGELSAASTPISMRS